MVHLPPIPDKIQKTLALSVERHHLNPWGEECQLAAPNSNLMQDELLTTQVVSLIVSTLKKA
jgi:HD-like signal output (HDOD) protein